MIQGSTVQCNAIRYGEMRCDTIYIFLGSVLKCHCRFYVRRKYVAGKKNSVSTCKNGLSKSCKAALLKVT